MAVSALEAEPQAMMEINTTPLIDIMLVLLIMFLVTIPIQTHAVKVDLPSSLPRLELVHPVKNKLVISASGTLFWNGEPVDRLRLRQYLEISKGMTPMPELHLQPDPNARYETVDEVLAITKHAHVEAVGFVGNEAFARF